MAAANERYSKIEGAILSTDPVTMTDDDLWHVLDLARILIKPEGPFTFQQVERGIEMLDLVRTALTRRSADARLAQMNRKGVHS